MNGDLVLCKAGHVVCEIVDASKLDVPNGWAAAFGKWRGPRTPRQGEPMPVCHVCGEAVQWPTTQKRVEFGHSYSHGRGLFIDSWGAGPFVIVARGKRYYFEDSDRFGPAFIDPKTGDPTNEVIPPHSPFWRAWERWKRDGRKTQPGKPLGTRNHPVEVLYCVHSDLRKTPDVED